MKNKHASRRGGSNSPSLDLKKRLDPTQQVVENSATNGVKKIAEEKAAVPAYRMEPEMTTSVGKKHSYRTMASEVDNGGDKSTLVYDNSVQPVEGMAEIQRTRWHLTFPSREHILYAAPFWGLIILAAILRFWGLGDKPLHHDESLHAYFSLQLMHNLEHWSSCFNPTAGCYRYDPLLHGPFQFHIIALSYKISQLLGVYPHGVNTTTLRIPAATLGTIIVGLPYFLRDYLGRRGALLASFLLAVSPSMVYFSRFAREDIYMACFTMLLVVSLARYVRSRKMHWLVLAAVGFVLSYTTKEATFLTIAVFGSFTVALLICEIGVRWPVNFRLNPNSSLVDLVPKTAAPLLIGALLIALAPLAKWFFGWMKDLSNYVNDPVHANTANAFVQALKDNTVAALPWLCATFGIIALGMLLLDLSAKNSKNERRGLAAHIDPATQPLLDTIVTMRWTHWCVAMLSGSAIFVVLFTVIFTNFKGGIGDGIWRGLYYWLQQQQVARGGQPWYYYFMLIPLYEQIGLVFGLIGIVRCLRHPSRFRSFVLYWFVGNVLIYSWAGEKMPWLTIHMVMPLMLLAALGLDPLVASLLQSVRCWRRTSAIKMSSAKFAYRSQNAKSTFGVNVRLVLGVIAALFLLALTLQNMFQLTYVHAADGPHEMMIYVQTTPDVTLVMSKIDVLDQKINNGNHQLTIGVTPDAEWPFYWYLRDYTKVCYGFPAQCSPSMPNPDIIISAGDTVLTSQTQYALPAKDGKQADYLFQQYQLRSWWDEGYKPPPCAKSATNTCSGQPLWGGVGTLLWLSYGDNPPPNASFDPGLAAQNIWQWWWQRKAIGSTMGATDMGFLIRKDLGMTP